MVVHVLTFTRQPGRLSTYTMDRPTVANDCFLSQRHLQILDAQLILLDRIRSCSNTENCSGWQPDCAAHSEAYNSSCATPPQLESYKDSGLWMPIEEVHCNAAQRESQGGFCHKHRHPRCDAVCAQRCHLPRARPARLQQRLLTLALLPKRQCTPSTVG